MEEQEAPVNWQAGALADIERQMVHVLTLWKTKPNQHFDQPRVLTEEQFLEDRLRDFRGSMEAYRLRNGAEVPDGALPKLLHLLRETRYELSQRSLELASCRIDLHGQEHKICTLEEKIEADRGWVDGALLENSELKIRVHDLEDELKEEGE